MNLKIIINFQLRVNREFEEYSVTQCYGVTKGPDENDYLLVFEYAKNGSLHSNLLKSFKEITWKDKINSLWKISEG